MKPPKKLLLFDLDGTLVRTGGAGRRALNQAAQRLFGSRGDAIFMSLAGKTDLRVFEEVVRAAVGRRPRRSEVDRLRKEYLRLLPRCVKVAVRAKRYELPPGIVPLLKRLKREKDVLLALGTGNLERGARIKLRPIGFNAYFPFGGFGSDAYHRHLILKKAVARARKRLRGGRIPPDRVYVIGDTPLDVRAGRKCGYRTIAVGTGFAKWADLKRSRPDHLARDFKGLDRWLRWLGLTGRKR